VNDVLAYRAALHGFGAAPPHDALLDLGVQDTPVGSAALALSARGLPETGLTTVWSYRGAPHRQRTKDLRWLARALWPLSDADALTRLGAMGGTLKKARLSGLDAVAATAAAMAEATTDGITKGELSAAVTKLLPPEYSLFCRGCQSTHVNESLFRMAALPAGVRIVSSQPLAFARVPRWTIPSAPRDTARVLQAYATLHGPCSPRDAGGYLGTSATHVRDAWPAVTQPDAGGDPGPFTRLLGPSDPYLQMRDRALLVPDRAHQKALWQILGGPGAVVVDCAVVGTWRAQRAGKALRVTVTPWRRFRRDGIEEEAARVASVKGAASFTLAYER